MTRWLLPLLVACVAWAAPAAAQRAVDTGWEEVTPSQFVTPDERAGVAFENIDIRERISFQEDDLAVITLRADFRNMTGIELYFDLDIIAVDASGEVLFVMKLSPVLYGVDEETAQRLKQSRYAMPGTLERVAKYRVRYVGTAP